MEPLEATPPSQPPSIRPDSGENSKVHDSDGTAFSSIRERVKAIANGLFHAICFPFRYVGAKNWSIPGALLRTPLVAWNYLMRRGEGGPELFSSCGYRHYPERQVTPEELITSYIPYGLLYKDQQKYEGYLEDCSYCAGWTKEVNTGEAWEFEYGYTIRAECYRRKLPGEEENSESAYETAILINCYVPKEKQSGLPCWLSKVCSYLLRNLFGGTPPPFEKSYELLCRIQREKPELFNGRVTVVGGCAFGALASYIALKNNKESEKSPIHAVCINSMPLGAGLQQVIGDEPLSKAHEQVTHISIDGDPICDPPLVSQLDQLLCRLGIRTPGFFGKRYSCPSAFSRWNCVDAHNRFVKSLSNCLRNSSPSPEGSELLSKLDAMKRKVQTRQSDKQTGESDETLST